MRALPLAALMLGCLTGPALPVSAQVAPGAATVPVVERKVSLQLQDVPLRQALDRLFQGTGLRYAVEPDIPNVPVRMVAQDVSLDTALRLLVRGAAARVPGLVSARGAEGYTLRVQQPRAPEAGAFRPDPFTVLAATRKVSASLDGTPLRQALKTLFQGTGVPYAIAPDVPDVRVTLSIEDMPLDRALGVWYRLAAMQEPNLAVQTLEGVYLVRMKPADPRHPRDRFVDAQGFVVEKIRLRNESVIALCKTFGWPLFKTEADIYGAGYDEVKEILMRAFGLGGGLGSRGGGLSGGPAGGPGFGGQ